VIKVSYFPAVDDEGQHVFPLFTQQDHVFEKVAAPGLRPEVIRYIEQLRPNRDSQYVLLNAMAASEYFSSNVNGDAFTEESLIHCPDKWTGDSAIDKGLARDWPYGFPCFYNAHPFAHHRNKRSDQAFGEVEYAGWHPGMKRVELVVRVDRDRCQRFGGMGVWDKLRGGQFPDVSMGTRVPFDTCFPAKTLVRTSSGHKPIEDVRVGDLVLTDVGILRTVTRTMKRIANDIVRVVASGLPEIRSTRHHPFLVVRREEVRTCKGSANGIILRHSPTKGNNRICVRCGSELNYRPTWVAAEDVRPGDYFMVPTSVCPKSVDVSLPRARMLGYYLGDGYIVKQRCGKKKDGDYKDMGVGFSVGSVEQEHLCRLSNTLSEVVLANAPNIYEAGCGRKAVMVVVYDRDVACWLQEHGGRTSRGKRLGEEVFCWSREAKLELVGGYIDTYGSFDVRGQVRIGSVNRGLLLDVQRLLLQEGIISTVCFAGVSNGFGEPTASWYLVLSTAQAQKLLGRSVKIKPVDVAHESPQSFFWGDYWLTPIKSVEELEDSTEVFNLSVEDRETYIVEGRTAHNCSICLDQKLYHEAQATFDPKAHKHPGEAVLQFHRKLRAAGKPGIRGLAITRVDYCVHAKQHMNKILPDGRKVFVYNDYPRFFDISFVFIGADKTAKAMVKIAEQQYRRLWSLPSAELAERLGYTDADVLPMEKAASVDLLKEAFLGKRAKLKDASITKDVVPSQLAGQAIPLLSAAEQDLPRDLVNRMGSIPLSDVLGTTTSMGMVLRPKEFQRVLLSGMGLGREADRLDDDGVVFPKVDTDADTTGRSFGFSPLLARLLEPFLTSRSAFGPFVDRRLTIVVVRPETQPSATSHPSELLRKIGAAYDGYRKMAMQLLPESIDNLDKHASSDACLSKLSSSRVDQLVTPLTFSYFRDAFSDELHADKTAQALVGRRGEGRPLGEHVCRDHIVRENRS
jgi:intein/homing endonuclease